MWVQKVTYSKYLKPAKSLLILVSLYLWTQSRTLTSQFALPPSHLYPENVFPSPLHFIMRQRLAWVSYGSMPASCLLVLVYYAIKMFLEPCGSSGPDVLMLPREIIPLGSGREDSDPIQYYWAHCTHAGSSRSSCL